MSEAPAPEAVKREANVPGQLEERLAWPVAMLLGLTLLLAAYWRVPEAGRALLFGDELHSLRRIEHGYRFLLTDFSSTGSGMALPLLQRGLADLFGPSHWSFRAPALLSGLALLASLYPLGRKLVRSNAAAIATCLAAGSSMLIYYSHYGRSYAGMAWLSLLLVYALQCIIDSTEPTRLSNRHYAYCAVLVAALPYVHLSSLAFVLAVIGAALVPLWMESRKREALQVAGAAGAGLVLAFLLHLPAYDSLAAFVSDKTTSAYFGEFGFWDVGALLAGGRGIAMLALPLLLVALARFARARGWRALPLIAACVAPGLALLVTRPFGDAYAYARYAISMLPFAFLAIGWLIDDLLGALQPEAREDPIRRRALGLALGVALAGALFLAGPYGLTRVDDGPHSNTYLSLLPLPAFDTPWSGTPAFYETLAEQPTGLRIIETPALVNRSRHLYRNYYLQHGVETWLGVLPEELATLPEGPYVSFDDPSWRQRANADYLILHHRIAEELSDYWRFVYMGQGAEVERPGVAAFMTRHSRFGRVARRGSAELAESLRQELGDPMYETQRLMVWDLREVDSTGGEAAR